MDSSSTKKLVLKTETVALLSGGRSRAQASMAPVTTLYSCTSTK